MSYLVERVPGGGVCANDGRTASGRSLPGNVRGVVHESTERAPPVAGPVGACIAPRGAGRARGQEAVRPRSTGGRTTALAFRRNTQHDREEEPCRRASPVHGPVSWPRS